VKGAHLPGTRKHFTAAEFLKRRNKRQSFRIITILLLLLISQATAHSLYLVRESGFHSGEDSIHGFLGCCNVQPWRWRQHEPPKRWYQTTTLNFATIQTTKNSDLYFLLWISLTRVSRGYVDTVAVRYFVKEILIWWHRVKWDKT